MLPELATQYPKIADITVDQLAGTHSGIPDHPNSGVIIKRVVGDPTHVFTADELIAAGMSLPLAEPGTGGYSTVADLGMWTGTGLGTSLLPADLAAKRFDLRDRQPHRIAHCCEASRRLAVPRPQGGARGLSQHDRHDRPVVVGGGS